MKTIRLISLGAVAVLAVGAFVWFGTGIGSEDQTSAISDEHQLPGLAGSVSGKLEASFFAAVAGTEMPVADGDIALDEYRNSMLDRETGMTLYWQNDGITLYVGLISPGTGWAGVGFSHRTGKPGSNIIIGAVSATGQVTLRDGYGITKALHATDQVSSLLTTGGSEANGQTILEFSIPLASTDPQDVALAPGDVVQVILAYQARKDSLTSEHTKYSMTQIQLDTD